jgi:hypothetical protein
VKTAVDKNNELSLVLSCQIFFLPLSALIVPHWFVDFLSKIKLFKVESQHTSDDGSVVSFDFREQESEGTQKLFNLADPWLNVLKNGYCLVMDELHNSLHPKLAAYLVSMFHNPEINNLFLLKAPSFHQKFLLPLLFP